MNGIDEYSTFEAIDNELLRLRDEQKEALSKKKKAEIKQKIINMEEILIKKQRNCKASAY